MLYALICTDKPDSMPKCAWQPGPIILPTSNRWAKR